MKIVLSNRSSVPIYEQIKQQIIEAILAGDVQADDLLPSIRQLAKDLKISVITTTRAYKDLESEGYVVNVQGKGCYVLPINPSINYENTMRQIEAHFFEAFELASRIQCSEEELIEILRTIMKESHDA
ncbi:GntR family transcriptional regulator [Erysipelothrix larvae]|uniref:GntR family transcriptional regulator n=1 Tax=Erysipelothrix larvae TaxID=1514105 RepID=A0A109UGH3_9FIRM|nr:GntR family transcriptional regulator [Erysipelothrix larvae]AMC92698.1 GntR family transcriptional regulator [Erysipelothrix larvae]